MDLTPDPFPNMEGELDSPFPQGKGAGGIGQEFAHDPTRPNCHHHLSLLWRGM